MKYKSKCSQKPLDECLCKLFAWSVLKRSSFSINKEYLQIFFFKFIAAHLVRFFCNSVEWHHLVAAMFISTFRVL